MQLPKHLNHRRQDGSARRVCRAIVVVLLSASLVTCATRHLSVSSVLQEGRHADGMSVQLTGDVLAAPETSPTGDNFYELSDGTGRISIHTRLPPPTVCHTVRIRGQAGSVFANETNSARPGRIYARWWVGLEIHETSREDLGLSPTAALFGCKETKSSSEPARSGATPGM